MSRLRLWLQCAGSPKHPSKRQSTHDRCKLSSKGGLGRPGLYLRVLHNCALPLLVPVVERTARSTRGAVQGRCIRMANVPVPRAAYFEPLRGHTIPHILYNTLYNTYIVLYRLSHPKIFPTHKGKICKGFQAWASIQMCPVHRVMAQNSSEYSPCSYMHVRGVFGASDRVGL